MLIFLSGSLKALQFYIMLPVLTMLIVSLMFLLKILKLYLSLPLSSTR